MISTGLIMNSIWRNWAKRFDRYMVTLKKFRIRRKGDDQV